MKLTKPVIQLVQMVLMKSQIQEFVYFAIHIAPYVQTQETITVHFVAKDTFWELMH